MHSCRKLNQCVSSSLLHSVAARSGPSVARLSRKSACRCQSRLIATNGTSSTTAVDWRHLPPPQVLYSNNHLLVVNKPPGWRSTPEASFAAASAGDSDDPKCLLSHLLRRRLGGGADGTFLRPLHRLDQPCSGVLLLGKTRRAAARVQSHWGTHVAKLYVCVLEASASPDDELAARLHRASRRATSLEDDVDPWMELSGWQLPTKLHHRAGISRADASQLKGWSVDMVAARKGVLAGGGASPEHNTRTIHWRLLRPDTLLVKTKQGSRHLIRALLGMAECPLAGDLRYGARQPLPDRSVALHARRLQLPLHLPLGRDTARDFVAEIPAVWEGFFGLTERDIRREIDQS